MIIKNRTGIWLMHCHLDVHLPWGLATAFEIENGPTKSIAIVGAGSAGLAALKALLDLPEETRQGWEIVLYEQRRGVGGVWCVQVPVLSPNTLGLRRWLSFMTLSSSLRL